MLNLIQKFTTQDSTEFNCYLVPRRIRGIVASAGTATLVLLLLAGCAGVTPDPQPPSEPETPPAEARVEIPQLSASAHNRYAIFMLESGRESLAKQHLERSLQAKPDQRLALMLLKQLVTDPIEYLGSESVPYTVKRKESLSMIAAQQLGDSLKFPILARYNNISNPSTLLTGTVIRVPVKASVQKPVVQVSPDELIAKANEAEENGDLELAYERITQAVVTAPDNVKIEEEAARLRDLLISDLEDTAYRSEVEEKIEETIAIWIRVLEIDPTNLAAQLNLKRLKP